VVVGQLSLLAWCGAPVARSATWLRLQQQALLVCLGCACIHTLWGRVYRPRAYVHVHQPLLTCASAGIFADLRRAAPLLLGGDNGPVVPSPPGGGQSPEETGSHVNDNPQQMLLRHQPLPNDGGSATNYGGSATAIKAWPIRCCWSARQLPRQNPHAAQLHDILPHLLHACRADGAMHSRLAPQQPQPTCFTSSSLCCT